MAGFKLESGVQGFRGAVNGAPLACLLHPGMHSAGWYVGGGFKSRLPLWIRDLLALRFQFCTVRVSPGGVGHRFYIIFTVTI